MKKIRITMISMALLGTSSISFAAVFPSSSEGSSSPPAYSPTQSTGSTPSPQIGNISETQINQLQKQAEKLLRDPATLQKTLDGIGQISKNPQDPTNETQGSTEVTQEDEVETARQEVKRIADQSSATNNDAMNDKAFQMLLDKALPLSPDQIKMMRKLYDISQEATAATPKAPPTPISSSSVISLEPGQTPPIIRLAAGFVSSVVFSDSTGAPWPLVSYTIGDPATFNIQWDQKSNTLFIQSLKLYAHGNLAVTLKDNPTPVMLSLISGQKDVDFRSDFQIAGRGPAAAAPIITDNFQNAQVNTVLINLLDGIPPKGSLKLDVSGKHGEAWLLNEKLYFRSKLVILSPAWIGTISSPDGTHVYEMMNTPSILASKDGQTVDIRLAGL